MAAAMLRLSRLCGERSRLAVKHRTRPHVGRAPGESHAALERHFRVIFVSMTRLSAAPMRSRLLAALQLLTAVAGLRASLYSGWGTVKAIQGRGHPPQRFRTERPSTHGVLGPHSSRIGVEATSARTFRKAAKMIGRSCSELQEA